MIEVAGTPASESSPEALRAVATPIPRNPAAAHASWAAASAVVLPVPGRAATATIRSPPVVRRRTISTCSVAQVAVAVEDGGEGGAVDHGRTGLLTLARDRHEALLQLPQARRRVVGGVERAGAAMDLDQPLAAEQGIDRRLQRPRVGALAQLVGHRAEQIATVEVGVVRLEVGEGAVELARRRSAGARDDWTRPSIRSIEARRRGRTLPLARSTPPAGCRGRRRSPWRRGCGRRRLRRRPPSWYRARPSPRRSPPGAGRSARSPAARSPRGRRSRCTTGSHSTPISRVTRARSAAW